MTSRNPYQAPKSMDSQHETVVYSFWKNAFKITFITPFLVACFTLLIAVSIGLPVGGFSDGLKQYEHWRSVWWLYVFIVIPLLYVLTLIPSIITGFMLAKFEQARQIELDSLGVGLLGCISFFLFFLMINLIGSLFGKDFTNFIENFWLVLLLSILHGIGSIIVHSLWCRSEF